MRKLTERRMILKWSEANLKSEEEKKRNIKIHSKTEKEYLRIKYFLYDMENAGGSRWITLEADFNQFTNLFLNKLKEEFGLLDQFLWYDSRYYEDTHSIEWQKNWLNNKAKEQIEDFYNICHNGFELITKKVDNLIKIAEVMKQYSDNWNEKSMKTWQETLDKCYPEAICCVIDLEIFKNKTKDKYSVYLDGNYTFDTFEDTLEKIKKYILEKVSELEKKDIVIRDESKILTGKGSKLREKTFKNSPKGRSEIPNRSGSYILLDKRGKKIYEGITNNLKRRIKEHHYDKSKDFSYIKIIRG